MRRQRSQRRPQQHRLAVLPEPQGPPLPRRSFAKWRALSLSLVYLVFAIHIIHWRITGKTLAPLELNEVMYTLELGIVTAGFLFMACLVLGTLFFGRFFCSWACHIMVLQDLCAWILRKLNIRRKPIRSRVLFWVPPLTAFYMFLWPQVVRSWQTRALPEFHFATDRDGWASFVTNNFWRNLPGPWIIALTFLVCGFLIVYLLGTRTFCTYVCPYGAIFGLADRFSPGRIRVSDACVQCGTCTAACTSGIRVHQEVGQHGMIVNPACLKDLDCVSACPQQALSYGLGRPALLKSLRSGGRFGSVAYDFSALEELLAAAVLVVGALTFRGLYGRIPFLLSLALAGIFAYLAVLTLRMFASPNVMLSTMRLKRLGAWTPQGWVFVPLAAVLGLFLAHSVFVRYHEYTGLRQVRALHELPEGPQANALAASVQDHLAMARRWGLMDNIRVDAGLLSASFRLQHFAEARGYAERLLARQPDDLHNRLRLARAYAGDGQPEQAEREFREVIARAAAGADAAPAVLASAHHALGELLVKQGRFEQAASELRIAVQLDPQRPAIHAELGSILAELGRLDEAVAALSEAVRGDPGLSGAHYNLGTILGVLGRFDEAVPHYEHALSLTPDDAEIRNNLGFALLKLGRFGKAREQFERAIDIDPAHAHAHFNLGGVLAEQRQFEQARQHYAAAARLDPRYARLLQSSQQ